MPCCEGGYEGTQGSLKELGAALLTASKRAGNSVSHPQVMGRRGLQAPERTAAWPAPMWPPVRPCWEDPEEPCQALDPCKIPEIFNACYFKPLHLRKCSCKKPALQAALVNSGCVSRGAGQVSARQPLVCHRIGGLFSPEKMG